MTTMLVDRPGCYTMSAEEYHADCCPSPSLSSSIANILLTKSPLHAWTAHPRLNPNYVPRRGEPLDMGTAIHALLLEGSADSIEVIATKDWRTNAAKAARDAARDAGKTPILAADWQDAELMVDALREQMGVFADRPIPLTSGQAEQTLVWWEGSVACRARLDWLHADHRTIDDLKSTGGSANPDAWIRGHLFTDGYDVQAAFYRRGVRAVFGTDALCRFVVAEVKPPYAVSVIALSPHALDLAERKVDRALRDWAHCVETNTWPAYPDRTCYADLPGWEEARWLEREVRGDGSDLSEQLTGDSS